jgi:hypothetical protein
MTYCNLHQPDFLTGSSDNTCGAATINSSHVASYEQCQGGGFSCQKFPGAWCMGWFVKGLAEQQADSNAAGSKHEVVCCFKCVECGMCSEMRWHLAAGGRV